MSLRIKELFHSNIDLLFKIDISKTKLCIISLVIQLQYKTLMKQEVNLDSGVITMSHITKTVQVHFDGCKTIYFIREIMLVELPSL